MDICTKNSLSYLYTKKTSPSGKLPCVSMGASGYPPHRACFLYIPGLTHTQTRHTFPYLMPDTTALTQSGEFFPIEVTSP